MTAAVISTPTTLRCHRTQPMRRNQLPIPITRRNRTTLAHAPRVPNHRRDHAPHTPLLRTLTIAAPTAVSTAVAAANTAMTQTNRNPPIATLTPTPQPPSRIAARR